ncbi:MAG: hypothetical protein QM689_12490 [Oscillospiraceae bacterium]
MKKLCLIGIIAGILLMIPAILDFKSFTYSKDTQQDTVIVDNDEIDYNWDAHLNTVATHSISAHLASDPDTWVFFDITGGDTIKPGTSYPTEVVTYTFRNHYGIKQKVDISSWKDVTTIQVVRQDSGAQNTITSIENAIEDGFGSSYGFDYVMIAVGCAVILASIIGLVNASNRVAVIAETVSHAKATAAYSSENTTCNTESDDEPHTPRKIAIMPKIVFCSMSYYMGKRNEIFTEIMKETRNKDLAENAVLEFDERSGFSEMPIIGNLPPSLPPKAKVDRVFQEMMEEINKP